MRDSVTGIHVHSQIAYDKDQLACLTINVWPLLDDEKVHMALTIAARDAIMAELVKIGWARGEPMDVPLTNPRKH